CSASSRRSPSVASSRSARSSMVAAATAASRASRSLTRLYSDGARTPTRAATACIVTPAGPVASRTARPAATISAYDVRSGVGIRHLRGIYPKLLAVAMIATHVSHGSHQTKEELVKIAPHVHRLGNDIVASYLIDTAEGITLVDAGLPGHWRDLQRKLRELGRPLADVRGLVLTHGDSDHIGFAERLRIEAGVPVYIHAADAQRARTGEKPKVAVGP